MTQLVALLDESTPVSIGAIFASRGHTAIQHGDVLNPGAKDDLVCITAINNEACLVAVDRDMRQMAKRFGNPEHNGKYAGLHLIFITCNPALGAQRLDQAMSFIEHEWNFTTEKRARTMWIEIAAHRLISYR